MCAVSGQLGEGNPFLPRQRFIQEASAPQGPGLCLGFERQDGGSGGGIDRIVPVPRAGGSPRSMLGNDTGQDEP